MPIIAQAQRGVIHPNSRRDQRTWTWSWTSRPTETASLPVPDSAPNRIAAFLTKVANDMPALASAYFDQTGAIQRMEWTDSLGLQRRSLDMLNTPAMSAAPAFGWPTEPPWMMGPRTPTPTREWLDSLAGLWPHIDPKLQAQFLFDINGSPFLEALLDHIAQAPADPAVSTIVDAWERIAHQPRFVEAPDAAYLISTARLASALRALARGDTAGALRPLREAATIETISASDYAVHGTFEAGLMYARLAEARRDTAQWFYALTLLRLRHSPTFGDPQAFLNDALLRDMYQRLTASGRPAPDLLPERLADDPRPRTPLSYDAYLDRQWAALFDRLPRYHAGLASRDMMARAKRLVVIEYTSSLGCGGCWQEDRELSAIERRYGDAHVLPLSFRAPGGDGPITGIGEDTERWYYEWYPRTGVAGSDTLHHGVTMQVYRSPRGDTLMGYRIDGQNRVQSKPVGSYLTRLRQAIDTEFARPSEARIRVEARREGARLHVTSNVDHVPPSRRVALRLLLVRDTVWLYSGHVRRLMFNTVMAVSHSDTLSMGLRIPPNGGAIQYTFDLARLQQGILAQRTTEGWAHFYGTVYWGTPEWQNDRARLIESRDGAIYRYPDPRDWRIDWSHVFLVAIVQDLDSGDMLDAVRLPLHLTSGT